MRNNNRKKKPKPQQQTSIAPAQQSITEPSTDVEARMVSKDQLENFLKDIWEELNQKTWWDHVDGVLIAIISVCAPILFQWCIDTFSAETLNKEAFSQARFILPLIGVVGGFILLVVLRSIRTHRNLGVKRTQFVKNGMDRFPMNSKATLFYSDYKPFNPSDGE